MNKIECIVNNRSYEIVLETYKILFGNNYDESYEVYKCLKNYFNKTPYSENYKENNIKNIVKLNENYVDVKNTMFFEIGMDFDFIIDSKLGTKSLLLKYFEYLLDGIEYDDGFNTIKELLYSFINIEIENIVDFEFENIKFSTKCDDFNFKSLIKYIIPILYKEDYEINNIDLSYDELINFQIILINAIAKHCNKNIFVIGNIPYISRKIQLELYNLNSNVKLLILSNALDFQSDIENILFVDLNWLDFKNEETVIDYLLSLPFSYTIDSLKNKISQNLNYYNFKQFLFKQK